MPNLNIQRIKDLVLANKLTVGLIIGILILVLGAFAAYAKFFPTPKVEEVVTEHDLQFDPTNSYALLIPRKDGHAISLNVRRVNDYSFFSYQITYSDDKGIDRGAGAFDTWIPIKENQSDFTQEILFGTCSKGDTSDPLHCVFDDGVENGTLELHFKKITKINSHLNQADVYKLTIPWHYQKPDLALGVLNSPDSHFVYKIAEKDNDLGIIGFTNINDLSGLPKLPADKQVAGKVYVLNVPTAKTLPDGDVSIELSQTPNADAKIAFYQDGKNDWQLLDTKVNKSTLTGSGKGAGIYAVFISK